MILQLFNVVLSDAKSELVENHSQGDQRPTDNQRPLDRAADEVGENEGGHKADTDPHGPRGPSRDFGGRILRLPDDKSAAGEGGDECEKEELGLEGREEKAEQAARPDSGGGADEGTVGIG